MPVIKLPRKEELAWGAVTDWTGDYFHNAKPAYQALLAEVDSIQQSAHTAIEARRQQALAAAGIIPPPFDGPAIAQINATFNALRGIVDAAVAGGKAALDAAKPSLTVYYVAQGGCPVSQNPCSVEHHNSDFDPENPPSFEQPATVTLSLPPGAPVVSIEVPMSVKWKHSFIMAHTKTGDEIEEQLAHTTSPPTEIWRRRAKSHHSYTLTYAAEIVLGPFSTTLDEVWVAVQEACSVWCDG